MSKSVSFRRPDGQTVSGYLAEPSAGAAPGVVVIQEWWGLNAQIRGVADRLANAGYRALVPDLYRGKSTVDAAEAHHLMTGLDFAPAASQDIRGAVQFLKQQSARVGITGFCMGGALTVLSLTMIPELDAGVIWYGHPPIDTVDAGKIRVPVLAHWALQDNPFPIAGVDALEAKFKSAGVNYQGHRYLAQHGFANETAVGPGRIPITQYDAVWAQQAWDRSFSFFGRTLSA
jgi:carboxymethylenebutenolidase